MRIPILIAVLLIGAAACKGASKTQGVEQELTVPADTLPPKQERVKKKPSQAEQLAEGVRERSRELLAEWTDAQKQLDVDAYLALYDQRTFRGIKRTNDGKVRDYDFAGWRKDRERMFKKQFEIATEPLSIRTWLDAGSKLKRNMVELRFTQRWRNARYADHGVKVLHAWHSAKGELKITYEDLLNSETGWDRVAENVEVVGIGDLKDDAAALAAWNSLAPTGADYHEKLASIPDMPSTRRALALALIRGGNFECKQVVEYSECGDEHIEWNDLDVNAGFSDPCLRRRLAAWSLEELDAADLAAVQEQILAIVRLPAPEEELVTLALDRIASAPEPLRMAVYRVVPESLVDLEGLSEKALIELATEYGVDEAVAQLDEVEELDELLGLLAEDEQIEDGTRMDILSRIGGVQSPKVVAALEELAVGDHCELAMEAAIQLAARKDESFLPRRSASGARDDEQALCMLVHDPDEVRRHKGLAEWIGPSGIEVLETDDNEFERYEDDDDDGLPNLEDDDYEKPEPEPTKIHTADELEELLERVFRHREGGEGDNLERADFTLGPADGGGSWIESFEFHTWSGCPC